jgi:hypothetical protein
MNPPTQDIFNLNPIKIGTVDYRDLNIPDQNSLTYICGYLIKKCLEKHVCPVCTDYAHSQKSLDQSFLLSFFKSYPTNDILTLYLEN